MTHSPTLGELFAALSKAQGEIKNAIKDTEGQVGKSIVRYADLGSIWDACRESLAKNDLCVLQPASADGNAVTVTTILGHSSGEWVSESMTVIATDATPRSVGSAVTYARRYSLAPIIGVTTEDDDGAAASDQAAQAEEQRRKDKLAAKLAAKNGTAPAAQTIAEVQGDGKPLATPVSYERLAELRQAMFDREPVEDPDAAWKSILAKRGVASAKELSLKGLEELTAAIEKKIADYDRDIDSFRGEASHDGLAAPAALAG